MMAELSVVEFSRYPAGRTDNDGPFNGAKYRRNILVPALDAAKRSGSRLRIVLDGARTYGSSFLDEAFGGLVRDEGYSAEEVRRLIDVVIVDPGYEMYRQLIFKFLTEAEAEAR